MRRAPASFSVSRDVISPSSLWVRRATERSRLPTLPTGSAASG